MFQAGSRLDGLWSFSRDKIVSISRPRKALSILLSRLLKKLASSDFVLCSNKMFIIYLGISGINDNPVIFALISLL